MFGREMHPLLLTELFEDWALDDVGGWRGTTIFFLGLFPSIYISAALFLVPSYIVLLRELRKGKGR